jgi:serine acetyltransferase
MAFNVYRSFIRPAWHKVKRFRNFVRDLIICIWRGWDFRLITACDINLSKIPKSTHFGHPVGIVISSKVLLGQNCDIKQNVTIGQKYETKKMYPVIGNGVQIGAGAVIIGNVNIGDNAVIGAGAVVLKNIPANTTYISKFEPAVIPNGVNT